MKNIAIIVGWLYEGGAERAAGLLSKYLSKIYNVYMFLIDTENIVYEYGGQIVNIGLKGGDYAEYYIDLYKRKYNIDCCISFLEPYNIWNIRTKGKEKVIISERDFMFQHANPPYAALYQARTLYRQADSIVGVAEGLRNILNYELNVPDNKITTIYNFIDQEYVRMKANQEMQQDIKAFIGDSKLLVNIGRLEEQKNQKRLIQQFSILRKKEDNVKLLIIGDGTLKEELTDFIIQLGEEKYIKILPYCENPFSYLKQADVFILSSHHEGLPNVLLETMSLSIPIVSVDCLSGPRELLDDNSNYGEKITGFKLGKKGILVENIKSDDSGDTCYLADAIKYILHNVEYALRIKENQSLFMKEYKNEKILEQWIEVIEKKIEHIKEFELKEIDLTKKVVVYGAGKISKIVLTQLERNNIEVSAIAVSEKKENPMQIKDIPVVAIHELAPYKQGIEIIMGVGLGNHNQVIKTLTDMGFENIHFPRLIPEEITK